jgi:hypothetical protein
MSFWKDVKKISKTVGKTLLKASPVILAAGAIIASVTPTPYDDAAIYAAKQALEIVSPTKD